MASHILIWLSCTIKVDNVMQTPFKSDIIINANYGSLRQQILRSCVIRSSDSVTLLRHTSFECRWDTNSTLSYANWHFHIIEWIQSVFSLFIPTLHTIPSAFSHPNIIQCGWSSPPPQTNRIGFRNVSTCFYRIYAQILVYWLSLNWIKVVITTTIPFIFDYVLECSTLTFGYRTSGSTDVEMSFHQVTGIVQLYRLFGCIFAGNIHCGTLRFSIHVKFRFVVRIFFIVWTIF